ncbi:hypothetical protein LguiB_015665 [Lonicera macranthoides]
MKIRVLSVAVVEVRLGLGGIIATFSFSFSVADAVYSHPDRASIIDALDRLPQPFVVSSLFEPGQNSKLKGKPSKS